jgi:hypothetical protein
MEFAENKEDFFQCEPMGQVRQTGKEWLLQFRTWIQLRNDSRKRLEMFSGLVLSEPYP